MSREITRAQRDWLEGEIAAWQTLGLVDREQAIALLGLYESRETFQARQRSKGLFTLMALAAMFVGLGVLLLVGYNWSEMAPPLKVFAIFATLIGTHASGYELRYRFGWRRFSEVVFLLVSLFFGAAIWLLAQIFQITSDNYDGLWWWALGVLPFALLLDTVLLHLLFAGLLALWLGFDILALDQLFWGIPSGGYTLPLLAAPGLWWAYRKNSVTTVGIYVPLIAWWVVLQPIAWKLQANPTFFIGTVASLMILTASLHPPGSAMAIPYRFCGVALAGATLIPLSFYQFNDGIGRGPDRGHWSGTGGLGQLILMLILAATMLVVAFFLQGARSGSDPDRRPPLTETLREIVRRQWMPLALLGLFAFLALWAPTTQDALVPTILANAGMIALGTWLIRLGLAEDRGWPFVAGVGYIVLWSILRYIDLFGAYGGMLGAALMFFLCGGAFLGVALFWRQRKAVALD
jgi:hypothetical protein